jgi:L-iditol 2-dehydrogenase
MGILAAQVLRAQGAHVTVSGITRDGTRLAVAETLGLRTVSAEALSEATPEGGFDVVADCSGSAAGIDAGLRATRRGGRYVQVGLAGRPIELDIDLVCLRELTVTSGFASTPRSWRRAERLVEGGHVRLEPLVSGAFPLSRWQEAFERTARAEGLKLVIDPRLEGAA